MNIKPITPKKINYVEIKQRKDEKNDSKNTLKKAAIITGAISTAALTGMLIAKKTNLLTKLPSFSKNTSKAPQRDFFNQFYPKAKQADTQVIKTILPNGVEKVDSISKHALYGTTQQTKLSRPINGVKTIQIFKFPNGDISKVSAFDSSGKIIKNVQYNYRYASKKGLSSILTTTASGETQIDFEYLKHLPEKLKSVNITYPDGTSKFTLIPHSLKDKLAELIHK